MDRKQAIEIIATNEFLKLSPFKKSKEQMMEEDVYMEIIHSN